MPVGSVDAIGTVTTNFFDSMGNLTGSATLSGSTVLSTNTFGYDLNGNRTNSTVWRRVAGVWTAATTTFVYDGQNRVVQTIDPDGGTNTVVYNSLGKQESTIDKLGRVTSYSYDYQGRLISTTYPDLSTESSTYDAAGNRASSTDRGGRTTTYFYDALNRLTQTVYADNTTNRTVYDDLGRVQFTVDARGTTNAFGYDVLGRRFAVTNAWGTSVAMVSRFGFDENGNQVTVTNGYGSAAQTVTTNVYDTLNRQWQTLFADGTKTSTAFDVLGRRVAETNQDNIETWFAYDGAGRLAAVTNALNKVTKYEYDEAGNLLRQIDALNRTNRFEYDVMGRRTKRVLGGDQTETLGYDLAGNLIRQTNFNSVVITNQYDVLNRLTNRSSINGYQIAYTYTTTGQRQSMTDVSGTTAYAYDTRDRLLTNAAPAGTLSYRYDANGNVTNIASSTASGTRVTYQYDSLNRLTNVVDAGLTGTQNTSYRFDGIGNLQSYTYPNGVTNRYTYDSLSRLTNLTWKLTTTALADFSYKLNLGGTRTNLTETVNGTSYTNRWSYDTLYRLTNDVLLATSGSGTNAYTYDDVGNRLSRTVSGFGSPFTASTNQSFNFDKGDRLDNDSNAGTASTMFDANGNTLSYSGTFQYDVENRLTNANNGAVLIVYNGDGQRVKKVTPTKTTLYLIDSRNPSGYAQVLEELTVSGGATNLACAYTYGLDLISQRQPGVVTNFYGYDGHGSVRFLLTLAGGISDTYVYDAYGKQLNASGSTLNNYRYTGEQFDSDLGFYYLRARYLDPNIGRFQTMDSFEGSQSEPLSLHKYLYAADNALNLVDPSGLDWNMTSLMTGVTTMGYVAANFVLANINTINRATVLVYEMTTDNVVMMGESAALGKAATLAKVEGGLGTWTTAVGKLKGIIFGPKAYLSEILRGTGRQANHLNQAGAYTLIEKEAGACVDLFGNALKNGTEHNQFHGALEQFWNQFRKGGAKFKEIVSNKEYLDALRNALSKVKDAATGAQKFTKQQIDALVELAEKEQRGYGYHDGQGGLHPEVPSSMNLTP